MSRVRRATCDVRRAGYKEAPWENEAVRELKPSVMSWRAQTMLHLPGVVLALEDDVADEDVDPLTRKVDEIGQKLDNLSASVDARFAAIDARFTAIDEHFVEQRQYIEYVYDTLRTEMHAGFQRVERQLDRFIDTQGGINRGHEVRISALESRRARRKG